MSYEMYPANLHRFEWRAAATLDAQPAIRNAILWHTQLYNSLDMGLMGNRPPCLGYLRDA